MKLASLTPLRTLLEIIKTYFQVPPQLKDWKRNNIFLYQNLLIKVCKIYVVIVVPHVLKANKFFCKKTYFHV